jgi:hypothetical protein
VCAVFLRSKRLSRSVTSRSYNLLLLSFAETHARTVARRCFVAAEHNEAEEILRYNGSSVKGTLSNEHDEYLGLEMQLVLSPFSFVGQNNISILRPDFGHLLSSQGKCYVLS